MKLKRQGDYSSNPQNNKAEYKKAPPIDWSLYEVDYEKEIPFGKYAGQTLNLIQRADERYYDWIIRNNMITEWTLVKLKREYTKPTNKDYDPFITSTGEIWLGLYVVKRSTM